MRFLTLDRNLPQPKEPCYRSYFFDKLPRRIFLADIEAPIACLGTLDRLSIEILNCMISSLNISALDQLKVVNRRGFEAVNAHHLVKNWKFELELSFWRQD